MLVTSQAANMDRDPEPPVLIEPDVLEEPGSGIVVSWSPNQILQLSQSQ